MFILCSVGRAPGHAFGVMDSPFGHDGSGARHVGVLATWV
jgi:hypothetical protein